jgi:hypothetical protein
MVEMDLARLRAAIESEDYARIGEVRTLSAAVFLALVARRLIREN